MSQPNRREFAKSLAVLALGPAAGQAQDEKPRDQLTTRAEALMTIVQQRFGKYLTEAQTKEVAKAVLRKQYGAQLLRQVKLKNSDEPAFVFRATLP